MCTYALSISEFPRQTNMRVRERVRLRALVCAQPRFNVISAQAAQRGRSGRIV